MNEEASDQTSGFTYYFLLITSYFSPKGFGEHLRQ